MWSGMEILSPAAACLPTSSLFTTRNRGAVQWTHEENKQFENALAVFDERTPDRWQKVASMIPGKTADDVRRHYQVLENDVSHIEAGLFPPPGYGSPQFTMEGLKQPFVLAGGKRTGGRPVDQERKKGVPWTEEEHKNISRNFVTTRTPTQVASHAQKYFIRLSSGGKDKRRSSIHDITTVNMSETAAAPLPPQTSVPAVVSEAAGIYNPPAAPPNPFGGGRPSYDISTYGVKFEAQSSLPEISGPWEEQALPFQMQ
ncbi:unnamed protein product [Spirodela intermedia]|uniref:Myb-like domain-containing protein n=1 Tax=Spirodela intermedia TaxID=51605 RepID=A0A7I8IBI1_SPIIN|nr:unnamed protein product [Spirodela intermedia]CAA6655106.1 unnamed protein product [Spirodela intermedia]